MGKGDGARRVLGAVFFATGFSALALQVVWQRVIVLHAGVDLSSSTTVVAAFLAGLGVGGLAGGWLADRLGPRGSLLLFGAANAVIGVYAWFSLHLLYDFYESNVGWVDGTAKAFVFNFALIAVPTLLMGFSLPLVTRAAVSDVSQAGTVVGSLYARNTLGAAAGAAVSGWVLLGAIGFEATVRIAGTLNVLCALAIVVVAHRWEPVQPADVEDPTPSTTGADVAASVNVFGSASWPWFVVYGITGAVALGLEVVFFRLVDGIMRSNSYTFAHVLALYLGLFGLGAVFGAHWVARTLRPDRWFLWIQCAIGIIVLVGVIVLVDGLPALGLRGWLRDYLQGPGLKLGFGVEGSGLRLPFALLLGPVLVMGAPVFLMGASFPFVQAVVSRSSSDLGRRTGILFASNVLGNVTGTLVVGFVLMDRLGTAGTVCLLAAVLLVGGVIVAGSMKARRRARVSVVGLVLLGALLLAAFPSNTQLWAFLHGRPTSEVHLSEDRSCAAALLDNGAGGYSMTINGTVENAYPFSDFHVLIGLLPTLVNPAARRALAIGLGIGATTFGLSIAPGLTTIDTVEICTGEFTLLTRVAVTDPDAVEYRTSLTDPRVKLIDGDGRKRLLTTDEPLDVVVVDALRYQSAYSGNLFSAEFYELVREKLSDHGLFVQWVPTNRSYNTVTSVFPYAIGVDFGDSSLVLASKAPFDFDVNTIVNRFEQLPHDRFRSAQVDSIISSLTKSHQECLRDGSPIDGFPSKATNHDLHPRDEYFLNNQNLPTHASCNRAP